jgi:hypothetical protein
MAEIICKRFQPSGSAWVWYDWGMKDVPYVNLTVFVLFFGIALIEAIQKGNWVEAALFIALGVMSLWADFKKT